jgi:tagatose-6-phosphate ketose/aldose isomerase
VNRLSALLRLSNSEKLERGLVYTPQEIAQQPETWLGTFKKLRPRLQVMRDFLAASGVMNPSAESPIVFLTGAGTSDYIGRSLHLLLQKSWQSEVIPVSTPDLLTDFSNYVLPQRPYLWISFSRSGDSPEGVAVLERALAQCPNVRHIVVSCNASGRMVHLTHGRPNVLCVLLDEVTNDRSLAMTSSFSNMVVAGHILAHAWNIEEYESICRSLSRAAESFLPRAASIAANLAGQHFSRVCFVGSGVLAGTAMESALKVTELTGGKVLAFSHSTLALRHGPMAALDRETLFVSFISSQEKRRKYELDLLREISSKSLVRTRLVVATVGTAPLQAEADYVLTPGTNYEIPDLYRPVIDVILGQLLGLFTSLELGLKPDTPSPNGAISRVVQNVEIYQ